MAKPDKDSLKPIKVLPFLTEAELARACGKSRQYIDYLRQWGYLRYCTTVDGHRLFPCPDKKKLVASICEKFGKRMKVGDTLN